LKGIGEGEGIIEYPYPKIHNTMSKKILIDASQKEEFRVAIVKDGILEDFYIQTLSLRQKVGNIYKGIVENIDHRLQACFVNFGQKKNGFLPTEEIHPQYWAVSDNKDIPIDMRIQKGQEVLVQVVKDMPGEKGAYLTTYVTLAGRYMVLTPGRDTIGVSRKIEDEKERKRLKRIATTLPLPSYMGCIMRTASEGIRKREILRELNRLLRLWTQIRERAKRGPSVTLIHEEQDICFRTLRDHYSRDIDEIWVDDTGLYKRLKQYMKILSPRDQKKIRLYKEDIPIFDRYNIEDQIERIYSRRVDLRSGGYIVVDSTEALIAIDVNSGSTIAGENRESMAFIINMEAAKEIPRQLRLRDIGGLVVIDFIDMKQREHIRDVEKRVREEIKKDRAKVELSRISKFGLMELSRQRLNPSIELKSYQVCPTCRGRGKVISVESASASILRNIKSIASKGGVKEVVATLPLDVASYILNAQRKELLNMEERFNMKIIIQGNEKIGSGESHIDFIRSDQII